MDIQQPVQQPAKAKKRMPQWLMLSLLAGTIVLVLALIVGYEVLNRRIKVKSSTPDLVQEVGQLYELPSGETPSVATVDDKSKLTNKAAFAKAENGDKVLVYSKAKLMIIYRPETNKIVSVIQLASSD